MYMQTSRGRQKDAAKAMAEEYKHSMKEARKALDDRDVKEYELHRSHMESYLKIGFVDTDGNVARVKDYLTQYEIHTPFGVLEIGGWKQ